MEPNHGVNAGAVRILLTRVGVLPWDLVAAKQHNELPTTMTPWELKVLPSASSEVLARRRFRSKSDAERARTEFVAASVTLTAADPVRVQTVLDKALASG